MNNKRSRLSWLASLPLALAMSTYSLASAQGAGGGFSAAPLVPESQYSAILEKGSSAPQVRHTGPRAASGEPLVSVIVKLDDDSLANYAGGVPGLPATSPSVTGADTLDVNTPASQMYLSYLAKQDDTFEFNAKNKITSVQVTHRYEVVLGGVSVLVPASQADQLAALSGVKAVFSDTLQHIDTDRTPQFLGAPTIWNQLGGQESAGDNVVIGVLDTGIWPEHPSFADPDPTGKPYGPKPATWHGTACEFTGGANPGAGFACNNKLIGAQRFMATYDALVGLGAGEYTTARDEDGHGTHTSSTAGGNAGVAASIFGVSRGIISGIAPRARIAMYKVCGTLGCFSSDSAAAVEQAIKDGVNVLNFSIGGGANPYADPVELAFLDAYDAGIFVAASAGNSGPDANTTDHRAPWVTTVAASTADRAFVSTATLVAGSRQLVVNGSSLTPGIASAAPITVAPDPFCIGPYAAGTFTGQVVVCERGGGPGRAEKGFNVLQGGAVGMLLYNQAANITDLETDNHYLPAIQIQYADGLALLAFIASDPTATVTWPAGFKASQQGDVMASFSSRGGSALSLGIAKPDVTAPGVEILAGASPQHLTPAQGGVANGPAGELFQAIAGTSMSNPHVAGSGALLKALHPKWTPGQIKSAIMTTAKTKVVKEDGVTPADAFDDGSGRVDLNKAGGAGLTFDESAANYVALADELWNANYPSLYVPIMPGSITVSRTVHNETNRQATWRLNVSSPPDVKVLVPNDIHVPANGSASFWITVQAPAVPLGAVRFAMLQLRHDDQVLHFPITFVRNQPEITLYKTCSPGTVSEDVSTTCNITATNTSFNDARVVIKDTLPKQLDLTDKRHITGATVKDDTLTFKGTLVGAAPPDVHVITGTSPAGGYLPLSSLGISPTMGVGDDTITNFSVPAFLYGGQTYTRIGVVSNGTIVVGGGSAADATPANQQLPDPTSPNNVLAPFWTDLNPPAGGTVSVGILSDGTHSWVVVDWNAVKEFSTPVTDTFEAWIGFGGAEDITYAYGPVFGKGDNNLMTAGAENLFGNRGQTYYYNGAGTLPSEGAQLRVTTVPAVPGGSKVISYKAHAHSRGPWRNCATLTSAAFPGVNDACFDGMATH